MKKDKLTFRMEMDTFIVKENNPRGQSVRFVSGCVPFSFQVADSTRSVKEIS